MTLEVAVEPAGAALADPTFQWRISVATISAPGPFSLLPGIDRHIVALGGAPVTLRHADGRAIALAAHAPYAFAGEEAIQAELTGEAHDFNVMVRRAWGRAEVEDLTLAPREPMSLDDARSTRFVFCAEGRLHVSMATHGEAILETWDAVCLPAHAEMAAKCTAETGARVIVVRILAHGTMSKDDGLR